MSARFLPEVILASGERQRSKKEVLIVKGMLQAHSRLHAKALDGLLCGEDESLGSRNPWIQF